MGGHYGRGTGSYGTRKADLDYEAIGIGVQFVLVGLGRLICWIFQLGVATARRMQASRQTKEPSINLKAPDARSFEAWTAGQQAAESRVCEAEEASHKYLAADDVLDEDDEEPPPEILIRSEDAPLPLDPDPEPQQYDIVREANGTVVLRYRNNPHVTEIRTGEEKLNPPPEPVWLEEPSRYRRKLIPPGSFNQQTRSIDRS